jgi:hypothetical protein
MYTTVLVLHSWVRWLALVAGFGATLAALRETGDGSVADTAAGRASDLWGVILVTALDVQLLLGLLLYFVVSPNMQEIRAHFAESMQGATTRFWAVEHVAAMLGAVVIAHVGRVLARKARTPAERRVRLLTCFGISTILMLAGMPWPWRAGGRPLFRV